MIIGSASFLSMRATSQVPSSRCLQNWQNLKENGFVVLLLVFNYIKDRTFKLKLQKTDWKKGGGDVQINSLTWISITNGSEGTLITHDDGWQALNSTEKPQNRTKTFACRAKDMSIHNNSLLRLWAPLNKQVQDQWLSLGNLPAWLNTLTSEGLAVCIPHQPENPRQSNCGTLGLFITSGLLTGWHRKARVGHFCKRTLEAALWPLLLTLLQSTVGLDECPHLLPYHKLKPWGCLLFPTPNAYVSTTRHSEYWPCRPHVRSWGVGLFQQHLRWDSYG